MKDLIRRVLPVYRRQFDGGRRPITDREIAGAVVSFDGLAIYCGDAGREALAEVRRLPGREAEDLILEVMRDVVV